MPDLKVDLLNKLKNEKYYDEIELIRLAAEPNMNYEEKINSMDEKLANIALLNAEISLVEFYLPEQRPVPQQVAPDEAPVAQQPRGQAHQGQSHGE